MLARRVGVELQMRRHQEAQTDATRAVALLQASADAETSSADIGRAHFLAGRSLEAQGQLKEAHGELSAAVQHLTPTLGAGHPETVPARQLAATDPERANTKTARRDR